VKNTGKNDPQKLAEWATASHVEKHTRPARKTGGGSGEIKYRTDPFMATSQPRIIR